MKKVLFVGIAILSLASFKIASDACDGLAFFKEGTQTTMTSFDEKGGVTGTTVTIYNKVTPTDKGVNVIASQEKFDTKNKSTNKTDFTIRCENSSLFFDMKMFIPQEQMKAYKDMEMTVDGTDMEIPAVLTEGMTLKDAQVNIKVSSKGTPMPMMNFSIIMTNRKVEKKESVTTTAGTFECYKLTNDMEVKSMIKMQGKSITWFSPKVGMVKSESYKENNKFIAKQELTEFK